MVLDLESEKAVDGSNRLGVVRGYSQLRTILSILGSVCDLAFQSLHVLYAWRDRGVDKHRNGKVALGKLYCDHRQVLTDGLSGCGIRDLIALNLNSAAVRQKMEMMGCFLVTKAHTLIATGVYARKIVLFVERRLLR